MVNRRIIALLLLSAVLLSVACALAMAETTAEISQEPEKTEIEERAEAAIGHFTDDPDAIERAAGSVVKLEVYDAQDNKIGTGSGFCAFDSFVLITAAHVIVNMDHIIATCDDGACFRLEAAVGGDEDSDTAWFRLPEGMELIPLSVSSETPRRGEKILAIGSQFGIVNLVTLGNIAGVWKSQGVDWLLFTAPVSSGSSGGPILNNNGEVVGVVSGTYDKGQNLNVATPIDRIQAILSPEIRMGVAENE